MADYSSMKDKMRREGQTEQASKFLEMTNKTERPFRVAPVSRIPVPGSESRMVRDAGSIDQPGPTRARALFDAVKTAVAKGREYGPEVEREILDALDTFDVIRAGQSDRESRNMPGFAEYDRQMRQFADKDYAAQQKGRAASKK